MMPATNCFNGGVRPILLSESLRLSLLDKEVVGLSPQAVAGYRSCLDMFIQSIGEKAVANSRLGVGKKLAR